MTTIPPTHNYESQVVFSNQQNNIKSNDVINWTIAPSGDDTYFDLFKSRMTFKVKMTGLTSTSSDKTIYVPVKKNMAGIVNNTKVTYTYWDGDSLASLPLSADNENIGQIRSLLNTITDNKHNNVVNEGLKELSYIAYDDVSSTNAATLGRPYDGKLFYNVLKFVQKSGSTVAYSTINVNFSDIFEGCSQERFINLTQMDAQIIPTNDDAYFYISNGKIKTMSSPTTNPVDTTFGGVFFDSCILWYHSYKTANEDAFDPEDTKLVKNQIMTKTFKIPANQGFIDDRVLVNFPIKMMFMVFTDDNGDFSSLKDVRFKRIAMNIAGEQKRILNVDNGNNPDGIDHTFFEWVDYLCNSRSDEYDTLLTYKTWRDQFRVFAFPIAEWFPQRAQNQLQFEIELDNSDDNAPNKTEILQMHLIMIRANQVQA